MIFLINEGEKEMEIRKPKFELGQKVVDKNGNVETVVGFNSYHFEDNEYWYDVSYDEGTHIKTESFLKQYSGNSETKKKTVWDLKENNTCFWINNGIPLSLHWNDSPEKIRNREIGNVFLTEGEALADLERRKIETEMISLGGRRKFESNRDNYGIYYCDGINVTFSSCTMYQGLIYFDTRKEAEEAIKEIGKNRIKKYVFGVNK